MGTFAVSLPGLSLGWSPPLPEGRSTRPRSPVLFLLTGYQFTI
nr:MAG TPA: hypothetical protein [Bacteriophage sp.]